MPSPAHLTLATACFLLVACSDADRNATHQPSGGSPQGAGAAGGAGGSPASGGAGGDTSSAAGASGGSGGGGGTGGIEGGAWVRLFPGSSGTSEELAVDINGNVAVRVLGTGADFGDGPVGKYVHVVKLDPRGELLWVRSYDASVAALAFDASGNLRLAGGVSGWQDLGNGPVGSGEERYVFALELDVDGALQWVKTLPAGGGAAWDMAIDFAGNTVLAGRFDSFLELGDSALAADDDDGFVLVLDPLGDPVWGKALGAEDAAIHEVAIAGGGGMVVAGDYQGKPASSWWLLDAGTTRRGFVAHVDAAGGLVWSQGVASGDGHVTCRHVSLDAAGNVSFSGAVYSIPEVSMPDADPQSFVTRLDADGHELWSTQWADEQIEPPTVRVTTDGTTHMAGRVDSDVVVAGTELDEFFSKKDILLGSFHPDGTPIELVRIGGKDFQSADALALDATGQRYISGPNTGELDLGFATIDHGFVSGTFVARLPY